VELETWKKRWQLGHRAKEPYSEKLKIINWKIKKLQSELEESQEEEQKGVINNDIDFYLNRRWEKEDEIKAIEGGIELARQQIFKYGGVLPQKLPPRIKEKKEYKPEPQRKGNTREVTEQSPGMPQEFFIFNTGKKNEGKS